MTHESLLLPDWPVSPRVRAVSTTRLGGISKGPWDSFNLADHVGDDAEQVARNRQTLVELATLPSSPVWLNQVHGCRVADPVSCGGNCSADAQVTTREGVVCAVMTADCLPVLLCNRQATRVAAVHAGWRGLAAGVLEQTLDYFPDPGGDIMAWLGPAIGPAVFEVGAEVRRAFLAVDAAAAAAFRETSPGHWLADLFLLARQRLARRGVVQVYGGEWCTYSEQERFFSYRRDGVTGRMASLIWLD